MSEQLNIHVGNLATAAFELVQFIRPSHHNLGRCVLYLLAMHTGGNDLKFVAETLEERSRPYRKEQAQ